MVALPDRTEWRALGALAFLNVGLSRAASSRAAIPSGLGGACLMLGVATQARLGSEELGLRPAHALRGARIGAGVGLAAGTAIAAGAFLPATRRFYRDERIINAPTGEALYHAFARVPLATALAEELIFRSALEAILARRRTRTQAVLISSALFGLWHVLPTLERLRRDHATSGFSEGNPLRQACLVAAAVGGTAVAGVGLSWLRHRSGSVIAPVCAHAAVNGAGLLAAWAVARAADAAGTGASSGP